MGCLSPLPFLPAASAGGPEVPPALRHPTLGGTPRSPTPHAPRRPTLGDAPRSPTPHPPRRPTSSTRPERKRMNERKRQRPLRLPRLRRREAGLFCSLGNFRRREPCEPSCLVAPTDEGPTSAADGVFGISARRCETKGTLSSARMCLLGHFPLFGNCQQISAAGGHVRSALWAGQW